MSPYLESHAAAMRQSNNWQPSRKRSPEMRGMLAERRRERVEQERAAARIYLEIPPENCSICTQVAGGYGRCAYHGAKLIQRAKGRA